jgi:muramidase (phage lysozyme)
VDADRIVDSVGSAQTNVRAFLYCIRVCEGTDHADGYRAMFGYPAPGRMFTDFADHPRVKFPFTQTDGARNYSSAAGAYQIIVATWDRLRAKLKLVDFSPGSQDLCAMELIAEDGAMADVKAGNFQAAIDKCAGTWASLPASHYPQPKRSLQFALDAYQTAGGMLA